MRATSRKDLPSLSNANARRLRLSSSPALPARRIHVHLVTIVAFFMQKSIICQAGDIKRLLQFLQAAQIGSAEDREASATEIMAAYRQFGGKTA